MEKYPDVLAALGHPVLQLPRMTVHPYGGRVMGLYPDGEQNVMWTNPALEDEVTAAPLLSSKTWTNLGGDRTWLSPEIEMFVADMDRVAETYRPPAAFDPGAYRVLSHSSVRVEMETEAEVDFFRTGSREKFRLHKRISALTAPDFPLPPGVAAAGYELRCTLAALQPLNPAVRPALWNLLQVPGNGEIIVPTARTNPVEFFGGAQYICGGGCLRVAVPAAAEPCKFGLLPEDCTGKMLYLKVATPRPFLIIRWFSVGRSGDYFDIPFTEPKSPGTVQQIYVDNGIYGNFGEMEHHSPALISGVRDQVADTCTTWAFIGTAGVLEQLARTIIDGEK